MTTRSGKRYAKQSDDEQTRQVVQLNKENLQFVLDRNTSLHYFRVFFDAPRTAQRYAIRITSDDGQTHRVVRLDTDPINALNEAQDRVSIENQDTYVAAPNENVLNFNQVSHAQTQRILNNFTKFELLSILNINNRQWKACIYAVLRIHQHLSLFIGSEEHARFVPYVFNDISCDPLYPPSTESLRIRPQFFRFNQLNDDICEWLVSTFPQIRVLEIQVIEPSFWNTPYVSAILSHYAHQLTTVRLSFDRYLFVPFMLLQPISEMPNLQNLTLNFPIGKWEYGADIIPANPVEEFIQVLPQTIVIGNEVIEIVPVMLRQIFSRLEIFHLYASTDLPMRRLLMANIAQFGVNNKLREISLHITGDEPNALEIRILPEVVRRKIVKLELRLNAFAQLTRELFDPFISLRVLILQQTAPFPIEEMFPPLARLQQLRHLTLWLSQANLTSFQLRLFENRQVILNNLPSLPSITSLQLFTITTSHHTLSYFPFADVFTGVRWVTLFWSKYHCPMHPWANGHEVKIACNKILCLPLAACPQLQKIYSYSYGYTPAPNNPNAAVFIQNNDDNLTFRWTNRDMQVE